MALGIGPASPTTVSNLFPSRAPSLSVTPSAPSSSSAEPTSSSSVPTEETSSSTSSLPTSSTQLISAANTAGSSANDITTSGKSFFQNKPAVIGVFAGAGVLVLLLLVCLIACLGRRRRKRQQQQLDREMDVSFQQTMNHAADGWRQAASLNPQPSTSLAKTQSVYSTASEASGSHPAYTQSPLREPQQQQQNYDLGHRQGNPSDEWGPASPPIVSLAVRGIVVEPQIVQPRRAQVHPAQGHAHADSPLAQMPSQSAEVSYHPNPQPTPLPTIYLSQSRYVVTPLPMDAAHSTPPPDMPTSPDMLTSPSMPITPTPFPNPFDEQQEGGQGQAKEQRLSTGFPLSPVPALPNPYGAD